MRDDDPLPGKTLLLINTGSTKKRFIFQRLKKLGLRVVVLHRERNWAQPYVDEWILADTYNHGESIEALRGYLAAGGTKFDGALTFWEDDVPLHAKVCAEFKLPGNTPDAALVTRDKHRMQETLRRCGLPHINQHLLRTKSDLDVAVAQVGFPAVLKPVYGADSQFVVMVHDVQEAEDAYRYLLKNCTPDYDPIYKYNRRLFLFQEFVDGHEFSLECYAQHGVPHVIGVHEKTSPPMPFFLETGDYLPPRVDEEEIDDLTEAAKAALIVLGVRDSVAHVEMKMTRKGPKIIEVASRMGGDYTFENVQEVYGFDLIRAAVQIALGHNVTETPRDEPRTVVASRFFLPEISGIITKIRGFDELKGHKSVVGYSLAKQVGDSVLRPPDGYESIGWISVKGHSVAETERVLQQLLRRISIEISPFRSYSSVGKTQRKDRFAPALIRKQGMLSLAKLEKLRTVSRDDLRKLRLGIACNVYDEGTSAVEKDLMSVGRNIETTLRDRGYELRFFDFNDLPRVFNELRESDVDLVFNVCERINNSSLLEPHAAAILDALQIPYTGSNTFTLGLCIDKIRVKKLLAYHGIPTPQWDYAYALDDDIRDDLRYPLIVKPANSDNSIGITNDSVVTDKKQLRRQMEYIIGELGSPALVEEYIEGDEYDVSIIGNDEHDLQVLPLSRSIFKEMPEGYWHIYPFDAKWSEDPAYEAILVQRPPKNISKKLESLITEIGLDTYNIVDCHDYGRVEVRVDDDGNPYVLEINPNPSINIGDCVCNSAKMVGLDYGDFLEELMAMAIKRYKDRPPYYHLQTSLL